MRLKSASDMPTLIFICIIFAKDCNNKQLRIIFFSIMCFGTNKTAYKKIKVQNKINIKNNSSDKVMIKTQTNISWISNF